MSSSIHKPGTEPNSLSSFIQNRKQGKGKSGSVPYFFPIADRVGLKRIKVTDLLANDRDWQGDALHITTISDIKGGTIVGSYNSTTKEWTPTLTANGELQFTPDPAYTGVVEPAWGMAV